MKLSTLFRLEENLHLDRKTLINLRWIAIVGQLFAINFVYHYLNLEFPIIETHIIVLVGLITNLYLQFKIKINQLKDFYSALFLIYDLIQLSILLYLTGGITNPFAILLIVPSIVSSTFLSMGTTIILGGLTILSLLVITKFYQLLPGIEKFGFTFPEYYILGTLVSIVIGLVFLSYFGIRFSGESKKRSDALDKLQEVMAKEYQLESLGGLAAAAAHSLGTPLATISVVIKELKNEIGDNSKHSKDLDLLISQTKRCSDILKQISKKEIKDDQFINKIKIEDLLDEIIRSFVDTTDKAIKLINDKDKNKIDIKRSPELVYGLKNFIDNSIKFAKSQINIEISSNNQNLSILISDDGPGFPDDVFNSLGDPYLKSKTIESEGKSGLGLGVFLSKNLLEKKKAKINFNNKKNLNGASVEISWKLKDIQI